MTGEKWARVPCFPYYEVSNLGHVRSYRAYKRFGSKLAAGEPMEITIIRGQAQLYDTEGRRYKYSVAKLVEQCFGQRPQQVWKLCPACKRALPGGRLVYADEVNLPDR